jgi:hypothetical protein
MSDDAGPAWPAAQDPAETRPKPEEPVARGPLDRRRSIEFVYDKTELETVSFDETHVGDMSREAFRVRYRDPGGADSMGFRVDFLKENLVSSRFEGFGFEFAATDVEAWGQPDDRIIPIFEYDAGVSIRYAYGHSAPTSGEDQIYLFEVPARAGMGIDFHGARLTIGIETLGTLGFFDGPFVGPIYAFNAGVYGHLEWRTSAGLMLSLHAAGGGIETVGLSVGMLF